MNVLKFNPKDNVSVIRFLDSLNNMESLLENSMVIYSSELKTKKDVMESIIRHGNLNHDQLDSERLKIHTLIETALDKKIPLTESVQNYLVSMDKLVKHKLTQIDNMEYNTRKCQLALLETQLFDLEDNQDYTYSVLESGVEIDQSILRQMDSNKKISPSGIREAVRIWTTMDEIHAQILKESLFEKMKYTLQYEMKHKKYSDLPLMKCIGLLESDMKDEYFDKEDIIDKIEDLFDDFADEVEDMLDEYYKDEIFENGFVANPFNVYSLTPFPVGSRTVQRTFMDLANADTDEQIEECLMDFGRYCTVCETFGPSILTEAGNSKIAKAARAVARKSDEFVNGPVKRNKEEADDIKTSLKKAADPMVRFIEDTLAKIKKADNEERRNVIIKGGVVPKVLRWVKRAIGLLAVGTFGGNVGAVIAGIGLLTYIVTDKDADQKQRTLLLKELESELEIVEEKIEDAKGDEKKQNKYELMRIRAKLKSDITKISLRLKY